MNAVFCAVFIISAALLAATAPEEFLSSLLGGARSAAQVALTLFCVYAVWMGLANVAESIGITKKTAKLFRPLCAKIFKTDSNEACEAAAMNLTCDLLGAGASTPFAVKAMAEFEKEGNAYAQKLLFIINAAGFQLIPSTVIALRAGYGSAAAADIFLPSLPKNKSRFLKNRSKPWNNRQSPSDCKRMRQSVKLMLPKNVSNSLKRNHELPASFPSSP